MAKELYPLYGIKVEMWHVNLEDPFDMEYCGDFLWGLGFQTGHYLIFDSGKAALEYMYENKKDASVSGFEYRYRIVPLDNSDNVFEEA